MLSCAEHASSCWEIVVYQLEEVVAAVALDLLFIRSFTLGFCDVFNELCLLLALQRQFDASSVNVTMQLNHNFALHDVAWLVERENRLNLNVASIGVASGVCKEVHLI